MQAPTKAAAELKQQGVLEAARNPNTSITAEDAEYKIVEETKKAGGMAYQFDPHASPEEKAAQARSHAPPGLLRDKKPNGMSIATDLDAKSDKQSSLPPPSVKSAVVPSPSTTNGSVNGVIKPEDLPDEERWARDRVGWEPRFGNGETAEEEKEQAEATLLEHETLLESKLDDRFFGEWFHNTGVIVFACIASWFVALLGGGLGWLFIVMAFCGTYYRTSIRRVRRNFRDDVSREMAKARLETDTESLEWINSFLVKFWPIYAPVLCDSIIASVDQVLSTSKPAFLDNLRLKTFVLGSKPPRMEHVKTYPKAQDDIVLMDWAFSFTPNDTDDLTAKQLKNRIQPKVVLEVRVGKAMVSKGLDVIVEDFAFSGLMRVKVKLQIAFPHIERVDICFLGRPEIDYVCKPLGGDTLGFDINFIPGLETFIKDMIHSTLEPMMYDPNVFPLEIAKMLAGSPVDQAIGVVAVTLHGANGLKNPDKFSGTPDPYVVVSLNGRTPLGKTKVVHGNASPRFNETLYVIITSFTDALTLQVFDFNEIRKDKELGTATFALDQLETEAEHENLQLEVKLSGKSRGVVQTDIRFFPVLTGRTLEDGTQEPPPETNTGIAKFTIEQAKELDGSKSMVGKLNPYAVLLLNGKEIHKSNILKRTNNPIFPNATKEILITDRKTAKLAVVIKDDRDLQADPIIGTYQVKLNDMLKLMDQGKEWFNLHGAKTGRMKATLQWKPVTIKGVTNNTGGYITPIGVMRLHFQNGRDLKNFETVGKSDPYARVLQSGIEKGRTVTFKNNLNPDWDEVIYVPMHSFREKLTLEVMDEESLGKDRSLGFVELSARDYISQSDDGEYLTYERTQMSRALRLPGRNGSKGTLNFTIAFYPTLNVADPEEEEEETAVETETSSLAKPPGDEPRRSGETARSKASALSSQTTDLARQLSAAEKEEVQEEEALTEKKLPKIKIEVEDLQKYQSGLIVFKLISADLSQDDVYVDVVMDDMAFPSFISSKARKKQIEFGEVGDAFVRELEFSRITLRLREKHDKDDDGENVVAKLTGPTLQTLQSCLYKPTVLTLRDNKDGTSKVVVWMKYIPVKMNLDPSESINNMGNLRVDVLDATDLPSADRNGYSDPYCKFELDDRDIYKTKIQKKTLNPTWGEYFECPIRSRTAGKFSVRVMDWDFGDKADLLGAARIDLMQLDPFRPKEVRLNLDGKSGTLRLRMLFKPDYVTRTRQGSSTFSGTFAVPGKVVGGGAKGVGKIGTSLIGGGVKGASFLRRGFSRKSRDDSASSADAASIIVDPPEDERSLKAPNGVALESPEGTPQKAIPIIQRSPPTPAGRTPPSSPPDTGHSRTRSFGSTMSGIGGGLSPAERGTATIAIISATNYPPSSNVRVHVKTVSSRGSTREFHKTKAIKSSSGSVNFGEREVCSISCAADTQFQLQVKDHSTFGIDDDLGEALFFVDDTTGGSEKTIKAGNGNIVLKTMFVRSEAGSESPTSIRSTLRPRSLLSKRDVSGRY